MDPQLPNDEETLEFGLEGFQVPRRTARLVAVYPHSDPLDVSSPYSVLAEYTEEQITALIAPPVSGRPQTPSEDEQEMDVDEPTGEALAPFKPISDPRPTCEKSIPSFQEVTEKEESASTDASESDDSDNFVTPSLAVVEDLYAQVRDSHSTKDRTVSLGDKIISSTKGDGLPTLLGETKFDRLPGSIPSFQLVFGQWAIYYTTQCQKFTATDVERLLYSMFCLYGNLVHDGRRYFHSLVLSTIQRIMAAMITRNEDTEDMVQERLSRTYSQLVNDLLLVFARTIDAFLQQTLQPATNSDVIAHARCIKRQETSLRPFQIKGCTNDISTCYITGLRKVIRPPSFTSAYQQVLLSAIHVSQQQCTTASEFDRTLNPADLDSPEPTEQTAIPRVSRLVLNLSSEAREVLTELGIIHSIYELSPTKLETEDVVDFLQALTLQDPDRVKNISELSITAVESPFYIPREEDLSDLHRLYEEYITERRAARARDSQQNPPCNSPPGNDAPEPQANDESSARDHSTPPSPSDNGSSDSSSLMNATIRRGGRLYMVFTADGQSRPRVFRLIEEDENALLSLLTTQTGISTTDALPTTDIPVTSILRRDPARATRHSTSVHENSGPLPAVRPGHQAASSTLLLDLLENRLQSVTAESNIPEAAPISFKPDILANHPLTTLMDDEEQITNKPEYGLVATNDTILCFSGSSGLHENPLIQQLDATVESAQSRIKREHAQTPSHPQAETLTEKLKRASVLAYQKILNNQLLAIPADILQITDLDSYNPTIQGDVSALYTTKLSALHDRMDFLGASIFCQKLFMSTDYLNHILMISPLTDLQLQVEAHNLHFAGFTGGSALNLLRKALGYFFYQHPLYQLQTEVVNQYALQSDSITWCSTDPSNNYQRAGGPVATCTYPPCQLSGACLMRHSTIMCGVYNSALTQLHVIATRLDHLQATSQLRLARETVSFSGLAHLNSRLIPMERSVHCHNILAAPLHESLKKAGMTTGNIVCGISPLLPVFGEYLSLHFPDVMKNEQNAEEFIRYCRDLNRLAGLLADFGFEVMYSPSNGDLYLRLTNITDDQVSAFCHFVRAMIVSSPEYSSSEKSTLNELFPTRYSTSPVPQRLLPTAYESDFTISSITESNISDFQTALSDRITKLTDEGPLLFNSEYLREANCFRMALPSGQNPFQLRMSWDSRSSALRSFVQALHRSETQFVDFTRYGLSPHLYPTKVRGCTVPLCTDNSCQANQDAMRTLLSELQQLKVREAEAGGLQKQSQWDHLFPDIETTHGQLHKQTLADLVRGDLGPAYTPGGRYKDSVPRSTLLEQLEELGWSFMDLQRLLPLFCCVVAGFYVKPGSGKRKKRARLYNATNTFYYSSSGQSYLISLAHDIPLALSARYLLLETTGVDSKEGPTLTIPN
ncbi:Oidioi.mRNA.OKI2018_I69.chr2.g5074.t1.cds [Oikopleura dioica]|uniref:Oidioi.mRNA.OKI2018_I69.chr2.g5074.t1.cds n=1 Tax=Oikopleura dioica TaxID=34765 RepID=A0ABN7T326_OIKDI|nr:Oidioi.mRNA.OKI2018_I69.chr2.g5074.t1.cds [Oikopleura dioica]